MKKLLVLFALCFSLTAQAQQQNSQWTNLAQTDDHITEGQNGSFTISKNRRNEEMGMITGRRINRKTQQITLMKMYVTRAHCFAGEGKLVTLSITGEFLYDNDFVQNAGTVGEAIANVICLSWAQTLQKQMEDKERGL